MNDLDELEDYYKRRLTELQQAYHKAAEPIIKRLCEIQNLRPMPPVVLIEAMDDPANKERMDRVIKQVERILKEQ